MRALRVSIQLNRQKQCQRRTLGRASHRVRLVFFVATVAAALTRGAFISTVQFPSDILVEFQPEEKVSFPIPSSFPSNHSFRILLKEPSSLALDNRTDSPPLQEMKRGLVPPGRGQVDPLVRLPSFGASTSRNINPEDDSIYENERQKLLDAMDKAEVVMNRRNFYHDDENEDDPPDHCDRPNWKSKFHPICNNFHEFDMLGAMSQDMFVYRGEATFRAAWTFDSQWVLKTIRFPWMKGLRIAMGLQKEAIILDALSGSPRIIDIYGFCGLNTIAEYMPYEAEDDMVRRFFNPAVKVKEIRESENRIRSLNRLSSLEVLDISIRLAESVADLHGYEGGVIAHGDLNTDQWLKDADGAIKLNDFNNGFIKDWNRQDQRYCTQTHGFVGQFFALESHNSFPNATEQVDIYGFGGSLYTIMTGLYPYWQYDRNDRNERISTGIPVPMESWWRQNNTLDLHLSDLIWWCMDSDFSKRPSIFEVIQELRNLRQMFLEGKLLGRRENDSPSHQVVSLIVEGSNLTKIDSRK